MSNRTRTATRSGPRSTISTRSPARSKPRWARPRASSSPGAPQTAVEVAEGDAELLLKLVDTLEEDDDVQTVWGNYEVSDAVLEKLG